MISKTTQRIALSLIIACLASASLLAAVDIPLRNWSAPATYTPSGARSGLHAESDIANPLPFVPITPCRQYSTVTAGLPLLQGVNRAVTLTGAPCGILASSAAVSVNITIFNITGATGNAVFKVDTVSPPVIAWINYPPTEIQRGNAGAVSLNGSGQIIVQIAQGAGQIDFVVDVNGYYYNGAIGNEMTSGEYFSILGRYVSGGVLYPWNRDPSGASDFGLNAFADSTGTGSAGVHGRSNAASGTTYGVLGDTLSSGSDAAGVRGIDATGGPGSGAITGHISAGVRGESNNHIGVYGLANYGAVVGELYNTVGGFIASGWLGSAFGTSADATGPPWGVYSIGNLGATGAKHFVEPHPTDPTRVILYSAMEGRTVDNYFRGSARFVNHEAVIWVPDDFRFVTDEEGLTVQLTPVGGAASVYVESQDLNRIVLKSSKDVQFHYLVQGIRRSFKDYPTVRIGYEFMPRSPEDRMPLALTDEVKRRLVANGTYNADGTVNMTTAERVGFTRIWKQREEEARAAAAAIAEAKRGATQGQPSATPR